MTSTLDTLNALPWFRKAAQLILAQSQGMSKRPGLNALLTAEDMDALNRLGWERLQEWAGDFDLESVDRAKMYRATEYCVPETGNFRVWVWNEGWDTEYFNPFGPSLFAVAQAVAVAQVSDGAWAQLWAMTAAPELVALGFDKEDREGGGLHWWCNDCPDAIKAPVLLVAALGAGQ